MSRHTLSSLAQLLLKTHFEMRDVLNDTLNASPVDVGFRMGPTHCNMRMRQSDGTLNLAFTEGNRSYHLTMPTRVAPGEQAKIRVIMRDGDSAKEHEFDGASLFNANVPEQFKALHSRVTEYLRKVLPESLVTKLQEYLADTKQEKAGADKPSGDAAAAESETGVAKNAAADTQVQQETSAADEYSWFLVARDGQPDLKFRGKLIGHVESVIRNGRQHVFDVFVTPSGKYVGLKRGLSLWIGERDLAQVQVFEKLEDIVAFFEQTPLAKALYAQLGLVNVEVLE